MKIILTIFVSQLLLISCASPGAGPNGIVFSKVSIGIYSTGDKSTVTDKACVHSILGLFAFGDASVEKIKSISGIKEVTDVNWEAKNFLGIYASLCVLVGGKK